MHIEVQPCYPICVVSKHAIIESICNVTLTGSDPSLLSSSSRGASRQSLVRLLLHTSHPPRNTSLMEIARSVLPLLLRSGIQCTSRRRMGCLVLQLRIRIKCNGEDRCKTTCNTTHPFRTRCKITKRESGRMTRCLHFASPQPGLAVTKRRKINRSQDRA